MSYYSSDTDTQSSLFDEDDNDAKGQKLLACIRQGDLLAETPVSGGDMSRYDDPKSAGVLFKLKRAAKGYIMKASDKAYAFWEVFKAVYGVYQGDSWALEQDAWAGTVYYQGESTTVGKLTARLEKALEMARPRTSEGFYDRQLDIFLESRQFKPVKKYLDKVYKEYTKKVNVTYVVTQEDVDYDKAHWDVGLELGDVQSREEPKVELLPEWDNLGEVLFGTKDPVTQEMITTWLVGAVKRALEPGCYMKRALILKGDQDAGKSAFVSKLGKFWGTELASGTSEMDMVRLITRTWIMELAECDRLFKGKDASILKQILSTTTDKYVPKYKEADEMSVTPRTTVFIGTTNKSQFLVDDTGNKRFWIIDMPDGWKLPLAWLEENVDQLWSTAYHKLVNGHPTDLSPASQVASEDRNRDYMVEGSWVEPLERVLETVTLDGSREVAFKMLDIQTAMGTHQDNHAKNKTSVINSLKQLGYEQKAIKVNGKTEKFYVLKVAKKPKLAKFEGGQWFTKNTNGTWLNQMESEIEARKESRKESK